MKKSGKARRARSTLEPPAPPETSIKPGQFAKMKKKLEEPEIDVERTKMQIVSSLAGINGDMRAFSDHIETKMMNAFNSKSGKQFGMSKQQMKKYGSAATLRKDDYDAMQAEAEAFLKEHQ